MARFLLLLFSFLYLAGCQSEPNPASAHEKEIEQWRSDRVEKLMDEGWLTLAGLYWLGDQEVRFGTAPDNDLIFPAEKGAAYIGTLKIVGDSVLMKVEPGIDVRHEDVAVTEMLLPSDVEGGPVILSSGSLVWYVIKREGQLAVRLRDTEHPALVNFKGFEHYPLASKWRLEGRFEPYDPPKTLQIPSITGGLAEQSAAGAAAFEVEGRTYRFDLIGALEDDAFFLIFADQTNGTETYGGGRYFWIDAPDEHGNLIIDFNRAYNPPCVFTPFATCPLPPRSHRLPYRVEAGEKNYDKS